MQTPELRILGVMTGTSCDGLDAACLSIEAGSWGPLWNASAPYPKALKARVLAAQEPGIKLSARDWLALHRDLGDWYAETLSKMVRGRKQQIPHVIANHGQTVSHFPAAAGQGTTLQLGDPTRIARATGLTVISHFREGDMAAGGQGAPLVPVFHQMLAHALSAARGGVAIHNIGGISNLTYVSPRGTLTSFDTGPGNIWIDAAASMASKGKLVMDRDGKLARKGSPDLKLVERWLKHPFFRQKPPKSTGRDDFPVSEIRKEKRVHGSDLVASATCLTVESIACAYEQWILEPRMPLNAIHVCGGGAKNPTLMAWLRARLPGIEVRRLDDSGFDSQTVEAQAFAFLGFLSLCGRPLGGPWTGARGFGSPGQITPGENWDEVLGLLGGII